jgi:hypothetical protein
MGSSPAARGSRRLTGADGLAPAATRWIAESYAGRSPPGETARMRAPICYRLGNLSQLAGGCQRPAAANSCFFSRTGRGSKIAHVIHAAGTLGDRKSRYAEFPPTAPARSSQLVGPEGFASENLVIALSKIVAKSIHFSYDQRRDSAGFVDAAGVRKRREWAYLWRKTQGRELEPDATGRASSCLARSIRCGVYRT